MSYMVGAETDLFGVEVTTGRDVILDFEDGIDRFSLGSETLNIKVVMARISRYCLFAFAID